MLTVHSFTLRSFGTAVLLGLFATTLAYAQPDPIDALDATDGLFENRTELTWTPPTTAALRIAIYRTPDGDVLDTNEDLLAGVAATVGQYVDTTGDPGQVYSYCLTVIDGAGNESATTCDDGSRKLFKPTGFRATDSTLEDEVLLTWTDRSQFESGFTITRNGTLLTTTSANATSFSDGTAAQGTTYTYCVAAINTDGFTSEQACDDGTRAFVTPPGNVSATDGQFTDRVQITWDDNSADETQYSVYRDGTLLGTVPADSTLFDDLTAVSEQVYTYCVTSTTGSTESVQVCDEGRRDGLTPPSNVEATIAVYDDRVELTWDDVADTEDGFELTRDGAPFDTLSANATRYNDFTAEQGTDYEYCVRAFSQADDTMPSYSAFVCASGRRATILAPDELTASEADYEDRVEMGWSSPSTTVMFFNVYRVDPATPNDTTLIATTVPELPFHIDRSLASDVDYSYCISGMTVPGAVLSLREQARGVIQEAQQRTFQVGREEAATASVVTPDQMARLVGVQASAFAESTKLCATGSRSLNAPTSVNAAFDATEDYVEITWLDNSGVERGYIIYRDATLSSPVDTVSASRSSFRDYDGVPGTTYPYHVVAYDANGTSQPGTDDGRRTLEPPTVVLASDGASETDVTITWKDNSRAEDGYQILRDGTPIDSTGANATKYIDTSGTIGQTYTYSVAAFDAKGTSTTASDDGSTAILPPGSLSASSSYADRVVVTWVDASSVEDAYRLTRRPSTSSTADLDTLLAANATTFTDSTAMSGVTYDYCVTAELGAEVSELSCAEGARFTPMTPPGASDYTLNKDISPNDRFSSVDPFATTLAIEGDNAIAIRGRTSIDEDHGVYFFEKQNDRWVQIGKDTSGPGRDRDDRVAISGTRIVLSDYFDREAVIYDKINGEWTQDRTLSNPQINNYGQSVDISGDYVIIGTALGEAFDIWEDSAGEWTKQTFVDPTGSSGDRFGADVAISGSYAAVTARQKGANGTLFFYERNPDDTWTLAAELEPDQCELWGEIDYLDADGERVLVSTRCDEFGAGLVYERQENDWVQTATLFPDSFGDPFSGEFSIASVAISGDYAVLGYDLKEVGDDEAAYGAAYLFQYSDGNWSQIAELVPNSYRGFTWIVGSVPVGGYGRSIDIEGDDFLVGAYNSGYALPGKLVLKPQNVSTSDGVYDNRIQVKWDDTARYEDGFNIYRRENGDYRLVGTTPPNLETFNDFDVPPGSSYEYCVTAFNNELLATSQALGETPIEPVTCDVGWVPPNGSISGRVAALGGGGTQDVDVCVTPNPNTGLLLDGEGGYAQIAHQDAIDLDVSAPFTMETWFRYSGDAGTGNQAGWGYIAAKRSENKLFPIALSVEPSRPGGLRFHMDDGTLNASALSGRTDLNDNQWHHVSAVNDPVAQEMRLYIDGVLDATASTASLSSTANTSPLFFGRSGNGMEQWFGGQIDEMRLWSLARTQEQIQADFARTLAGTEPGLVGYWPMDQAADVAIIDVTDTAAHGILEAGAYPTEAGAFDVCALTDLEGNYNIPGLRYGSQTKYTVTPFQNQRSFGPAFKTITLTPDSPVQNEVDFIDNTSFTLAGKVLFQNTECPVPDVDFFVGPPNAAELKGSSEADGTFALSVDPSNLSQPDNDPRRVEPRLGVGQDVHGFLPADVSLVVSSDIDTLTFIDTKTRTLSGFFGGGCGFGIGTATLKIFTEDSCYTQTVQVGGPFNLTLPPQAYLVQITDIDVDPGLAHLEADIVQYFDDLGVQRVDLTEAGDTLDLTYRAPLAVSFEGFPEPPATCDALTLFDEDGNALRSIPSVPVLEPFERVPLRISVFEDYGDDQCPVTEGTLTLFDNIADRGGEPESLEIENGVAFYMTEGLSPNVFAGARIEGIDRSFQKSLTAIASVPNRDAVTETQWVVVEGMRERESTFVSATTDPIPLMVLHDPPGSNSYAYIEEGTTMCSRMSSLSLFGGAGGFKADVIIGTEAEVGIGVSVEGGLGVKLEAEAFIGREDTELSAGACFNPESIAAALGGALAVAAFAPPLAPLLLPLAVTTVGECDGDPQERNLQICTTFTERLATHDDQTWVGEDLYVGTALNLIFAEADVLKVEDTTCTVDLSETLATNLDETDPFETTYVYGGSHIGLTLVPALENLRDLAEEEIRLTGDPDGDGAEETITLQQAIDTWNGHLALTETLTQWGIEGSCVLRDGAGEPILDEDGQPFQISCENESPIFPTENRSFSSGVNYENSVTTVESRTTSLHVTRIHVDAEGAVGGVATIFGYDSELLAAFEVRKEYVTEEETNEESATTIGYVLSDGDTGDYFSVDVGTDPVYGTPVFNTVSGRSSNPHESNTQQRDKPELSVFPPAMENVPADEAAQFTLSLTNASESQERREYVLAIVKQNNPGSLFLSITGDPIDGDTYLVEPGQTQEISLQVERGPTRYNYEDVAMIVYPETEYEIWQADPRQSFALSDTVFFDISFEAPCSDISILRPREFWTLNATTIGDSLDVILTDFIQQVSEDDAIERLGLEYRFAGTPDWLPAVDVFTSDLAEEVTSWTARWKPARDGDYEVRAFTSCPIGGSVYSEPLPGLVDTRAPQVFGTPAPVDEVLSLGADISVTFEEELDCATVDTDGPYANTFLTYADGPDAGTVIPSDALCNGETLILTPDEGFDWAQAENRLLEARLRKGIVDDQGNPREVTDAAGNAIDADVAWTFTVRRSAFTWQPSNLRVGSSPTLAATLVNGRAQEADFTLSGVPSWLTPSLTEGTLPPGGSLPITFAVDLSAPLAADTIAAVTASGNALLYLECAPPDWQVNPADFAYSMTFTGQLFVDGVASDDANDLVAAFVGDQLRGLAAVVPDGGGNRVPLTIYSNTAEGETVTFRVYDASACLTYPGTDRVETFVNGSAVGTQEQPVALVPTFTAPQQQIALNAGWTWFSLNRTPGSSVLRDVLGTVEAATGDVVKSQTAFSLFDPAAGWVGAQAEVTTGRSYQIRLTGGGTLVLDGSEATATTPIPVVAGWNWIGYLPQTSLEVNTALASLVATDGDQIKSQYQFAQYDAGSGQWVGSLTQLDPGLGYQLHVAQGGTLVYPAAQAEADEDRLVAVRANGPATAQTLTLQTDSTTSTPELAFDPAAYPHGMTLIGELTFDGEALTDPASRVWATDEAGAVRGIGRVQQVDGLDAPRVFLMLYGGEPQGEAFDVHVYDPATEQTVTLPQRLNFKADVRAGSLHEPVAIAAETEAYQAARAAAELPTEYALQQNYPNPFNPTTTIRYELPETSNVSLIVYDVLGREVLRLVDTEQAAGRYNVALDASRLASGVYLYRIEAGTFKQVRQMVLMK